VRAYASYSERPTTFDERLHLRLALILKAARVSVQLRALGVSVMMCELSGDELGALRTSTSGRISKAWCREGLRPSVPK